MELGMMAPMLVERLNGQLGRAAIRKLAFVQRAPRLAAPPRAARRRPGSGGGAGPARHPAGGGAPGRPGAAGARRLRQAVTALLDSPAPLRQM
jgi:hypothetical protein